MKKNKYSFFILAAIGFVLGISSCKKGAFNDTEKETELIVNNVPFSIPASIKPGSSDSITSFYYKLNMDSFVKKLDGKFDTTDIRSATLKSCVLTMDNAGAPDNFRNLHICTIGITTGKIRRLTRIATRTDILDTPAYTLDVPDPYGPNLKDYIMADSTRYRIYGNIRKTATTPITGTARLVFQVRLSR